MPEIPANVARVIAYLNAAEYALTKVVEHATTDMEREAAQAALDATLRVHDARPTTDPR